MEFDLRNLLLEIVENEFLRQRSIWEELTCFRFIIVFTLACIAFISVFSMFVEEKELNLNLFQVIPLSKNFYQLFQIFSFQFFPSVYFSFTSELYELKLSFASTVLFKEVNSSLCLQMFSQAKVEDYFF